MKKLYTFLALVITTITFAQAPQGFNYQATVRNSTGALIVNQNVNFRFNVMLNSATSVPVFTETHLVPTDELGQVNLVIGQGTATVGTFSTINWGTGNYYLGIELNTGSGYVAMGTTQLLSVPYALYANSSATSATPNLASVLAVNNGANNLRISNLANPINAQDAVTKSYLETQLALLQNQIAALTIGSIGALNCQEVINTGNLLEANAVTNATIVIPYISGNGGTHSGQTIMATGVNGLTATLIGGNFNYGTGTLTYRITGTPQSGGIASFAINIGGQTCTVTRSVTVTVFPKLAVPGNHQGWSPSTAPKLASSGIGATDYEGYIWLDGGFKFLAPDNAGNFSWGNNDWGDDGTFTNRLLLINEVDCNAAPAGYYRLLANTTTLTYTKEITTWSIIGSGTPGGTTTDTPMVYNPTTKKWTVTVTLSAQSAPNGGLKFRANGSWTLHYGDTGADGSLDQGGTSISTPAGTKTITLDLSNPRAYTYSIQ
jgi:hypothetical protein